VRLIRFQFDVRKKKNQLLTSFWFFGEVPKKIRFSKKGCGSKSRLDAAIDRLSKNQFLTLVINMI
jgi:hypothetical protein